MGPERSGLRDTRSWAACEVADKKNEMIREGERLCGEMQPPVGPAKRGSGDRRWLVGAKRL